MLTRFPLWARARAVSYTHLEALVPVEVKASNNRSKSLRTLIDSEHYPDIHFGIKLAGTNIGYGNGVYTFPYFCSFLLKE